MKPNTNNEVAKTPIKLSKRPYYYECGDLERELTKMTKERNDALQAYIVLDASYKMLRQELANLRNALALGGPLNKKQQEYINLHETIHRT